MDHEQIIQELADIGWTVGKDGVGDKFCTWQLKDRTLSIVPRLKIMTNKNKLDTLPSITTKDFSDAVEEISNGQVKDEVLVVNYGNDSIFYNPEFSPDDIREISSSILNWAKNQDIESAYESLHIKLKHLNGSIPLRHLAALAICGKTDLIQSYLDSFTKGDRLGFPEYITDDYISRALVISEQNI